MNDVTFAMDRIRRAAMVQLAETSVMRDERFASYAVGVIDLVMRLSEAAGEDVKDSCLDKVGEAGE